MADDITEAKAATSFETPKNSRWAWLNKLKPHRRESQAQTRPEAAASGWQSLIDRLSSSGETQDVKAAQALTNLYPELTSLIDTSPSFEGEFDREIEATQKGQDHLRDRVRRAFMSGDSETIALLINQLSSDTSRELAKTYPDSRNANKISGLKERIDNCKVADLGVLGQMRGNKEYIRGNSSLNTGNRPTRVDWLDTAVFKNYYDQRSSQVARPSVPTPQK